MRIILNEMKKIWIQPGTLLIILLAVFWQLLFIGDAKWLYFGDTEDNIALEYMAEWIDRYGTSLDDQAFEEIQMQYDDQLIEAAQPSEETSDLLVYQVQAMESFIAAVQQHWQEPETLPAYYDAGEKQTAAIEALIGEDAYRNMFHYRAEEFLDSYARRAVSGIVLCIFLLLGPVIIRDRMSGMVPMQWSSAVGRDIMGKQLLACLISGILIIIAGTIFYAIDFSSTGVLFLRESHLASFAALTTPVMNITYGQLCIIYIAAGSLLALAAVGIIFAISVRMEHYIQLLIATVIAFALTTAFIMRFCKNLNNFYNPINELTSIPFASFIPFIFLLIAAYAVCLYHNKKMRKADLL